MSDDWDDETPAMQTTNEYAREGGSGFMSRGRGFSNNNFNNRQENNSYDSKDEVNEWQEDSSTKNDMWQDQGNNEDRSPRRGGGRGRGRGGGRGGRGGRGGGRGGWNNDDSGGFEGSNDCDDNNGNRFGGRGNRGRGNSGRDGDDGRRSARNEENGGTEGETPEVKKEIYIPPEPTNDENEMFSNGITTGINFHKFDDIEVKVSGDNAPQHITSFKSAGLRSLLVDNVTKSGYKTPTPIQKYSIPIVMANHDLMACAQTGSGKTAAFLLPIINNLLTNPVDLVVDSEHSEPQCVVVSPTRELAIQIFEEARKFAFNSAIKVVIAYGGTAVGYQRRHVMSGCHILVATPGRLHDFLGKGVISFSSIRYVVLDEADRMLDMGFRTNMEEMMNHATMPPAGERNTLMFSATFPEEIQRLASQFLKDYIFVTVGIVGSASSDVDQQFHKVDKFKKRTELQNILKTEGTEGTLVFVETKRNADFLATFLSENDYRTTSIHGDRLQREREEALREFKRGSSHILVATAVAARGLDIKNVKHVINYDLPKTIDEYVHRIGRTGRVGNRGKATSFYDEGQDGPLARDLAKILEQAGQPIPEWLNGGSSAGGFSNGSSFGGQDVRGNSVQPQIVEFTEEDW